MAAPRGGQILTDERLQGRWARLRPALLAAAAVVVIALGIRELSTPAQPAWRVNSPGVAASGTYSGEALVHRASLSPGGQLFAGTAPVRLNLECQRGISMHAEATQGTEAFIQESRWLEDDCMQVELSLVGEGELLLISGCEGGPSLSVADRVEANVETPEGRVRFLGGAISIKRSPDGVSVALDHGRAEIQSTGRDTITLEPGNQVLILPSGKIIQDPIYFEKSESDQAIFDRLAPLLNAQSDLAEGVF